MGIWESKTKKKDIGRWRLWGTAAVIVIFLVIPTQLVMAGKTGCDIEGEIGAERGNTDRDSIYFAKENDRIGKSGSKSDHTHIVNTAIMDIDGTMEIGNIVDIDNSKSIDNSMGIDNTMDMDAAMSIGNIMDIGNVIGINNTMDIEDEEDLQQKDVTEDAADMLERYIDESEMAEIQNLVDELLGEKSISVWDTSKSIIAGKQPFSREILCQMVYEAFLGVFARQRDIFMQVILLILVGGVFANFSNAFGKSQIGQVSYYVVYLVLFTLLISGFGELASQLGGYLQTMVRLMEGIAPAYFVLVALSSGISTATLFYEGVLLLVLAVDVLLLNFVLPCINLYVLLALVNQLSNEDLLSKLADLLRTVAEWSLKTLLGLVVGVQVVQSLVAPVIDTLKRTAVGKTASAIPGIGGAMNAVTEIMLTSAILVRNSLGVVILVVLLLCGLTPALRYGLTALLYKLLAALAQPISDKKTVGCITAVGDGCVLLLKTLFAMEVLCMVTLVLIMGNK